MGRTLVRDIRGKIGQRVTVKGFVHVLRDQKAVQFVILRDQTGMVQIVVERSEKNRTINDLIATLTHESAVDVTGIVAANAAGQIRSDRNTTRNLSM